MTIIEILLEKITSLPKKETLFIAIDGRGGSGKSTLAEILQKLLPDVKVVRLDDIVYPMEDADRKRLLDQVILPLKENKTAKYQKLDYPNKKNSDKWHEIMPGGIVIVEGLSTLHDDLYKHFDFKIWIECPAEIGFNQGVARDLARDGVDNSKDWSEKWMPEEKKYIGEQQPEKKADIVIDYKSLITGTTKVGQCYLCGIFGKLTDEHVPPKFLSPNSPDSDFAKISVCSKDNNSNSHEESKFRDFLVTAAYSPENPTTKGAFEAMMRNYQRNPMAQLFGKPNKDLLRVWSGMKKQAIYSPAGIYLGEGVLISPAADVRWRDILINIARRLHFLFTGQIIPPDYIAITYFINKIDHPEIFKLLHIHKSAGDFFHFKGGWAKEDQRAGIWYMSFYKKVRAVVYFFPPSFKHRKPVISTK